VVAFHQQVPAVSTPTATQQLAVLTHLQHRRQLLVREPLAHLPQHEPQLMFHDKNRRFNQQKCRGISATASVLIMRYHLPQHEPQLVAVQHAAAVPVHALPHLPQQNG
jgi:hypothetical protein